MTKWQITCVCFAFVAAAGQGLTVEARASTTKHHAVAHPAQKSPYAQQCAAIWPQYLNASISDGVEMDDPLSPADIKNLKQAFNLVCGSKGPDAPEIQGMLH
jgi:hypothetical protein